MERRRLGKSGLTVPALSFGTMTFGGKGRFKHVGAVDQAGADRMVALCRDVGIESVI